MARRRRMTLGREKHKVLRHVAGGYDEIGRYTGDRWEEIEIRGSIHGGLFWNATRFSDAGDIPKQSISCRFDDPVYMATVEIAGIPARNADRVYWDNAWWEVRDCRAYKNLRVTKHWEAVCLRLDDSQLERV